MGAPGANAAQRGPARPAPDGARSERTRNAPRYDCIVIGGGHNGLVCAGVPGARRDARCWCWRRPTQLGGAAVTREFAPGFRVSAVRAPAAPDARAADRANWVSKRTACASRRRRLPTVALAPDGAADASCGPAGIAGACALRRADAAAYARLHASSCGASPRRCSRCSSRRRRASAPTRWRDRVALLGLGWRVRRLGPARHARAAAHRRHERLRPARRALRVAAAARARSASMPCSAPISARARRAR